MTELKHLLQKLLLDIAKNDTFNTNLIPLLLDIFDTIMALPKCNYEIIAIATYLIEIIEQKADVLDNNFIQKAIELKTHFLYLIIEYNSLNSNLSCATPLYNKEFAAFIGDTTLL